MATSSSLLEYGHDEDRDGEVCSYCASNGKLQPALYFCSDCGVYGKFICVKCLKNHNKFEKNHEVEKIGNQSTSRRTTDNDFKFKELQQSFEELQMDNTKLREEKETLTKELFDCKVARDKEKNEAAKTKVLDCNLERGNKNRCIVKEREDLKRFILKSNYKPCLLVAAIDIGITYSGFAFSFKNDFELDPTRIYLNIWDGGSIRTHKVPTCVLIHPDGNTLHSFGYEAEDKFAELAEDNNHTQWFFFKHFKMNIDCGLGKDHTIMVMDVTGKQLKAKTVLALAIKYLMQDCISCLQKTCDGIEFNDVRWVFTVPAIWNDAAKQFMIDVIEEAGISKNLQTIATEPVAASLYCQNLQADRFLGRHKAPFGTLTARKKYMVLDVGGKTTQITVLKLLNDGDFQELYAQCDEGIGGSKVNEAYETFLSEIFGTNVITLFKQRYQFESDYIYMIRDFETKKSTLTPTQNKKVSLQIPNELFELLNDTNGRPLKERIALSRYKNQIVLARGRMRIENEVFESFFEVQLRSIAVNIKVILAEREVSGCSTILMVGGLSESAMLQEYIQRKFPDKNIYILPQDSGVAVLKGAVIYGHKY